jgi:hypothetical protein
MFWINNKKIDLLIDVLQDIRGRVNYLEESIRMLKDEVRKGHSYPTCNKEYAYYKEIIGILSNIEDRICTEESEDAISDHCL